MKNNIETFFLLIATIIAILIIEATSLPVDACNTPVFQYALLRWNPEPYRIFVFYKSNFSPDQLQAIKLLEPLEQRSLIIYKQIDINSLSNADNPIKYLWRTIKGEFPHLQLPIIVVRFPVSERNDNIYVDSLSISAIKQIISSPVRIEIADKLANGAIVWLISLTHDKTHNAKIKKILSDELNAYSQRYSQANLSKLEFAIIELKRDDKNENFIFKLLAKIYPALTNTNEIIAFPIFGRGRILFPIPEKKLTHKAIFAACDFMTGPCACEIKDQNPGIDLLLNVDWDNLASSSDEFIDQMLPSAETPDVKKTTANEIQANNKLKHNSDNDNNKQQHKTDNSSKKHPRAPNTHSPKKFKFKSIVDNNPYLAIYLTIAAVIIAFITASIITYKARKK